MIPFNFPLKTYEKATPKPAPIQNVLIAGTTGSVGAPILAALLEEPSLKITNLKHASSSAIYPENVPIKTVSDAYTTAELTEALRNQDAVVIAITTTAVVSDTTNSNDGLTFRLIDAAAAAAVRRVISSRFGANNLDPRARKFVPTYDREGKILDYLIQKAAASHGKLTWTSISCGSWLDWDLDAAKSGNFLDIDVKRRKATIWDSGNARFAVTTSRNTGLAVARALKKADETENKQVFLADFVATPNAVVAALEKRTGQKFAIEHKDSAPELKMWRERFDAGEIAATSPLLALSFVADVDVGYDFEREQEVWNRRLGLPKVTLEDVIEQAVELTKRS